MKVETNKQFWEIAENWYQRTHRLREAFENESDPKRKEKAFNLFYIMLRRMQKIIIKACEINSPILPKDFKKGGNQHVKTA